MVEEDILNELRTIRTLLTLEKEKRLREIAGDLSNIQRDIIQQLDYEDWIRGFSEDIAEEHDVTKRHVQRETKELVEKNLIDRRGAASGTEYRKTPILRAIDLADAL